MSFSEKQPDISEPLAKMAEGSPGAGLEPIQMNAQQSSQSLIADKVPKSRRPTSSMSESLDEKTTQRIRAASLCSDVRRTGLVSTQFTSKDTVRVLNDQTGQSVVVACNQSTRDALASLVQRDSEAEKKEAAAAKMAREETEMRAVMEQHAIKFFEEQEKKRMEISASSPKSRPNSVQPKKRSNYRQQPFPDSISMSNQEAQTLLITYLNYTQPDFAGINYQLLSEQQQRLAPILTTPQTSPKTKSSPVQAHEKVIKESTVDTATATAIVLDTSLISVQQLDTPDKTKAEATTSVEPEKTKTTPQPNSRAYFGISRFLEPSEEKEETPPIPVSVVPVVPPKPRKSTKKTANSTIRVSKSTEIAAKKPTTKKAFKSVVGSIEVSMTEVVGATTPIPHPTSSQVKVVPVFADPMVTIASAIHEYPQEPPKPKEPEPEDPERSRLFLWAPGTRSNRGKSDSPSLHKTDAELIEFLRKPLEKAREEEREAARRKMLDPSPKRKPRSSASNGNNSAASKSSSSSNSNQPPVVEITKTVETKEPTEAVLQDSLVLSQSPPCDFLDDQLLDSFEDFDFANFQQQQVTTESFSGTSESYRSLRLDMPLGQAMVEVPLESIAGHLQTQKELFFLKKEGKIPASETDMLQTGEQHQMTAVMETSAPNKKKAPAKRKKPVKIDGEGSSTAQPKKKRAPSKKKTALHVEEQQMEAMVPVESHQVQGYQQQQQQRLPSVSNLLPPINQQSNGMPPSYAIGSSQEMNGQSSSTYQSYNYSMNTQSERPKKQQSLASMLQPLTCASTIAPSNQQTMADIPSYPENSMVYTMGNSNEYYTYEDHNSQMSADYSAAEGNMQYPPLSVESHISYQSQESNAPHSHVSSMPQTPISNHGSVYNNLVVNDNQAAFAQYGQMTDLYAPQEYYPPVDNQNQQYQNGDQQSGLSYVGDLQQQQQQQQQQNGKSHQIGELQRLTPTDITEFFSEQSAELSNENIATDLNPSTHSSHRGTPNSYPVVVSDNVRIMPDGRQEILNFVGEDEECEMSTCPADCNKCQTKDGTQMPPSLDNESTRQSTPRATPAPNTTNGSSLLPPDSEQISYVEYLSPTGTNGASSVPTKAPARKRSRAKKRADQKFAQYNQTQILQKLGQSGTLDSFPVTMSIGELLKKRSQMSTNVFMQAANCNSLQKSEMLNVPETATILDTNIEEELAPAPPPPPPPPPPPLPPASAPSRRPTSRNPEPKNDDPVLETINTVISNVMGVNDALELYLPVEELNLPANIKAQHQDAIEKSRQHQLAVKRAQLAQQAKANKKPPPRKLPDQKVNSIQRQDCSIEYIKMSHHMEPKDLSTDNQVYYKAKPSTPPKSSGKPNVPRPSPRQLPQLVPQRNPQGQFIARQAQGGQAVIQHYNLPNQYPSKLAQLLQKPNNGPVYKNFQPPRPYAPSSNELYFDDSACQPSTSAQAAQQPMQLKFQKKTNLTRSMSRDLSSPSASRPSSAPVGKTSSGGKARSRKPSLKRDLESEKGGGSSSQTPSDKEEEARIMKIIKEKLANEAATGTPNGVPSKSEEQQQKPKQNSNVRAKQVREAMRLALSHGPLTPEEVLGSMEGRDVDEYNSEYLEHYKRITQEMHDNPCVPEITVDDVLEQPELEPALHGRFRKRLAAVRAGKTTITKPPPKKKKQTKTIEQTCTATISLQPSTSTTTTSRPSTSRPPPTTTTTTIKAIVVPSLDTSPDGSGPSTSTDVLSQPLSVLTNDNTNSIGPSPIVSGVQTPIEPILNQQLEYAQPAVMETQFQSTSYSYSSSYEDGQNTYIRSCTNLNPMPYNILEGEDEIPEEDEEALRRRDEESRMVMYEHNQRTSSNNALADFSFDGLGESGPHSALLSGSNDPFLGTTDHISHDDPFLSGNDNGLRPRGAFDFDDEDFDMGRDVIDLSGSDNTGPSTPSVGILDDPSAFDSMESSFHGIFASPPCSPMLHVENPLQDNPVVVSNDAEIMYLHSELAHPLDVHKASFEWATADLMLIEEKNSPTKSRIARTNFKTIVKKQAVQLSNADLYNLKYKTTRKRGNEFLNPSEKRGSGFHLMDQLKEEKRFSQGASANITVREIVSKHVNIVDLTASSQLQKPPAVADVLEKMEEEHAYLMTKVEAGRLLNQEDKKERRPSVPPQRRGFYQWPDSSGYGELTIPSKQSKSNKRSSNIHEENTASSKSPSTKHRLP